MTEVAKDQKNLEQPAKSNSGSASNKEALSIKTVQLPKAARHKSYLDESSELTQEEIIEISRAARNRNDNWQTEIEDELLRLSNRPEEQRKVLQGLKQIPPTAFMCIKTEENQLVALPKLHFADRIESWFFSGNYFLKHAVSPRVKVEIAKQFPLWPSHFYRLMSELKTEPKLQIELLKTVDFIEPNIFGLIKSKEGQRLAVGKINYQGKAISCINGTKRLLNLALSDDIKLEIAKRYPSDFALETAVLIQETKNNPKLQFELIKSAKRIYPTAFEHIVTVRGQQTAVEKLLYPSKKDGAKLSPKITQSYRDSLTPEFLKEYKEEYSLKNLQKAALNQDIAKRLKDRFGQGDL